MVNLGQAEHKPVAVVIVRVDSDQDHAPCADVIGHPRALLFVLPGIRFQKGVCLKHRAGVSSQAGRAGFPELVSVEQGSGQHSVLAQGLLACLLLFHALGRALASDDDRADGRVVWVLGAFIATIMSGTEQAASLEVLGVPGLQLCGQFAQASITSLTTILVDHGLRAPRERKGGHADDRSEPPTQSFHRGGAPVVGAEGQRAVHLSAELNERERVEAAGHSENLEVAACRAQRAARRACEHQQVSRAVGVFLVAHPQQRSFRGACLLQRLPVRAEARDERLFNPGCSGWSAAAQSNAELPMIWPLAADGPASGSASTSAMLGIGALQATQASRSTALHALAVVVAGQRLATTNNTSMLSQHQPLARVLLARKLLPALGVQLAPAFNAILGALELDQKELGVLEGRLRACHHRLGGFVNLCKDVTEIVYFADGLGQRLQGLRVDSNLKRLQVEGDALLLEDPVPPALGRVLVLGLFFQELLQLGVDVRQRDLLVVACLHERQLAHQRAHNLLGRNAVRHRKLLVQFFGSLRDRGSGRELEAPGLALLDVVLVPVAPSRVMPEP
eukprot:525481-Rhodomonas_salina.5